MPVAACLWFLCVSSTCLWLLLGSPGVTQLQPGAVLMPQPWGAGCAKQAGVWAAVLKPAEEQSLLTLYIRHIYEYMQSWLINNPGNGS